MWPRLRSASSSLRRSAKKTRKVTSSKARPPAWGLDGLLRCNSIADAFLSPFTALTDVFGEMRLSCFQPPYTQMPVPSSPLLLAYHVLIFRQHDSTARLPRSTTLPHAPYPLFLFQHTMPVFFTVLSHLLTAAHRDALSPAPGFISEIFTCFSTALSPRLHSVQAGSL